MGIGRAGFPVLFPCASGFRQSGCLEEAIVFVDVQQNADPVTGLVHHEPRLSHLVLPLNGGLGTETSGLRKRLWIRETNAGRFLPLLQFAAAEDVPYSFHPVVPNAVDLIVQKNRHVAVTGDELDLVADPQRVIGILQLQMTVFR